LSAELTKNTPLFRLFFWRFCPLGITMWKKNHC